MRYTRLAILSFTIGVGLVAYAKQAPKARVDVAAGKELFREHCSVCHGLDAKGTGSLYDPSAAGNGQRDAEVSRGTPPADLTVLSERNAGKFPAARVTDAIYSKGSIPAHGTPDMPAWGDVFHNLKSNPKVIDARVRNLTAYIESLQSTGK
jgi:mono/diheme cytochrome c family protein